MPVITVTPATLAAGLKSCAPGDVLALAPGDYGPLSIAKRTFDPPLTIKSADPAKPARFTKATISGGGGVDLVGLVFAYVPDMTTVADTPVVYLNATSRVRILGGEITGGLAVNGVPEEALTLDKSGNVIGWPTCRGVSVLNSSDVVVEGVDIHHCHRGIILTTSRRVSILGGKIHHQRKTGIAGGADEVRIEGNHFHSNRPWRYGQTPAGDHGDWIAIWTSDKGLDGVYIRDNLMETGEGLPMMGCWIGGKSGGIIDDWEMARNTIIGGDHQGLMVSNATNGRIIDNVLMQDVASAKHLGIIVRTGAEDTEVRGNTAGSISDPAKVAGNTLVAKPAADLISGAVAAAKAVIAKPGPVVTAPTQDDLRKLLANRTSAKLEPLKKSGRLVVNFATPAQGEAALAAVLAIA